ncbi:hypothetical protein TIFTF001_029705 [Ficus carica]|uniref:Uncharacterized protein n=1 Tax=Ficus carica TaxID=3494 RepID=A0AA88IYH0_FICCA|nr:hypothetical protein TIFTF001_029705 [Ficus carica]
MGRERGGRGWGPWERGEEREREREREEKREKGEEREGGSLAAGRQGLGPVVGGPEVGCRGREEKREKGEEREMRRERKGKRKKIAGGWWPEVSRRIGGGSPVSVIGGGTHPFFSHSLCYNMTVHMVLHVHP